MEFLYSTLDIVAMRSDIGRSVFTSVTAWLNLALILAVIVMSIVFIKDRAWLKLLGFLGFAVVIAVLVNNAQWFVDTAESEGSNLVGA